MICYRGAMLIRAKALAATWIAALTALASACGGKGGDNAATRPPALVSAARADASAAAAAAGVGGAVRGARRSGRGSRPGRSAAAGPGRRGLEDARLPGRGAGR